METTVKQKIGKYEITGILGRGGMGVVYRAEDKRIGRRVAIKTLTEGFSGQPEMLERFYREAQAGILQHPNIVIVYDLGDEDGIPFIVMEFVEGDPLDKLINSGRKIPLIDKLSIIEQVCAGLGYAHRRGGVHRDIKPANVIVQPDGQAKIVDFGIARVQGSGVEGGLTRTGNVIGTVHYISPERLKGQPFDGRSDIFATGVMLYLLLAGQLPFDGEDMTVLQKLVNEPHPPLGTWLTAYPPELDGILEKALAKDPEQRYATAEEFAADLHGLGEELKKGQISELFDDAERLTSEQQFGRAREVLLQLVRIDPQHTAARQLLGIVQQNLARMQRAEQVRQLMGEAEEAISSSRFPEALNALDQAVRLDPENEGLKAKLAEAKEKKQRYEEIGSLLSQADSLKDRGDWNGALSVVEKALKLDQQDSKIRALYVDYGRQAKIAAQQGQIRDLLGKAKTELSSRRYTAAIEILREVGKIDPSQAEMESLLQTAVSGQEQERRRKLLEQIQAEIENCLSAEDYDRAIELVERAVQQLPTESSLLQLKGRVSLQTRNFKVRQLVTSTVARAQELFLESPGEALLVVQKALQELPGEERLLALEDSLRQRLKAAEKEEVKGRYLREAQDAMGRGQFDQAIEVLESYQLEFADAGGVSELLELARTEQAQQKRRERIAASIAQARSLMQEERFDQAIRLLEPASAETGDPALARLLAEARTQREEFERKAGAVMARIARLRERGQLDEAIEQLQALPSASQSGTQANALLTEMRSELARKQATSKALSGATQFIEQGNFQAAIESLESVPRAWGESPELKRANGEIEARRKQIANEVLAKAVETARAALVANDSAAALKELKSVASQVEFADAAQQADWRRLGSEAAKPASRKSTGNVAKLDFEPAQDEAPKKNMLVPLIAGGALVAVLAVGGFFVFHKTPPPPPPQQPQPEQKNPEPPPLAEPMGTVLIQGKLPDVMVFVDGALKGMTQHDGTLSLSLPAKTYTVKLVKPGYTDFTPPQVTVSANGNVAIPYQLEASTVKETTGLLTVQSEPGAFVSIDGFAKGSVDSKGELILQVQEGSHKLDVNKDGFQPFSKQFNIKASTKLPFPAKLAAVVKPVEIPKAQPVTAFISTSVQRIEQGQSTTLSWQTANATDVSIDNGIGPVSPSGQKDITPSSSTTFTLTAKGDGGTQQRTVSVIVEPKVEKQNEPPKPPPPVDQGALVRAALDNFNSALAAHDVGKMQSLGLKSGDAKNLRNFFKDSPTAKMSDDCPPSALSIAGDTATWACTETTTVVISGKPQSRSLGIRYTFTKRGGNWAITDRR